MKSGDDLGNNSRNTKLLVGGTKAAKRESRKRKKDNEVYTPADQGY